MFAFVGAISAITQVALVPWFVPKLGEFRAVVVSLTIFALGMIAYGEATEGWMMFVIVGSFGLISMAGQPAIQSLLSQQVADERQG